jgi:hypothetical protein
MRCSYVQTGRVLMDRQVLEWKLEADLLWSAAAPDYRAAERLAADIARASEDPQLRRTATLALPSLRTASLEDADIGSRQLAWQRMGAMRDVLHARDAPRFGQRGNAPKPLSVTDRQRQLLGLPLGRRLSGPEIHQAYKRAAKQAHPDGGGDTRKFQELSAARDALMKEK